jgi:prepilin-type N-terminal cleavage/methylation domain-containing protein
MRTHRIDAGFTLIELLVVVAILSIVTAIATPGLLRARMTSNEASAIASLKVMTSAQVAYSASCGSGGYAPSFTVLATPVTPGGPGFLSEDLGNAIVPLKTGFRFTLTPGLGASPAAADCNGSVTTTKYYGTATPIGFQSTGTRSFAVSSAGTIWQLSLGTAPTEPFTAPAVPIQ